MKLIDIYNSVVFISLFLTLIPIFFKVKRSFIRISFIFYAPLVIFSFRQKGPDVHAYVEIAQGVKGSGDPAFDFLLRLSFDFFNEIWPVLAIPIILWFIKFHVLSKWISLQSLLTMMLFEVIFFTVNREFIQIRTAISYSLITILIFLPGFRVISSILAISAHISSLLALAVVWFLKFKRRLYPVLIFLTLLFIVEDDIFYRYDRYASYTGHNYLNNYDNYTATLLFVCIFTILYFFSSKNRETHSIYLVGFMYYASALIIDVNIFSYRMYGIGNQFLLLLLFLFFDRSRYRKLFLGIIYIAIIFSFFYKENYFLTTMGF
jgi:hypothetical protein